MKFSKNVLKSRNFPKFYEKVYIFKKFAKETEFST